MEFFSKSNNPLADKENLIYLYQAGLLHTNSTKHKLEELSLTTKTFWSCFKEAIDSNPRGDNGRIRVLSIIADNFKYEEIQKELNVSNYVYFYFSI
jgi:hypothetical protein